MPSPQSSCAPAEPAGPAFGPASFYPEARHRPLRARLDRALADGSAPALGDALPAWLELRRAQTRASTLLRLAGDSYPTITDPPRLPRDPLRLYALASDPEAPATHWFLAQYGPDAGQPAAVQLFSVQWTDGAPAPVIANPAPPTAVADCLPDDLQRERAREVRTHWIEGEAHVFVQFAHGRLSLTARLTAHDAAVLAVRWDDGSEEPLFWERSERGDGARLLGHARPEGADWRDDRLFAPGPPPMPINPPADDGVPSGRLLVGRVSAVDRDPARPHRLWFGNNRARVHGLDLHRPDFVQTSPMLAGTLSDLLLVSPPGAWPARLLAICSDGIAYLLAAQDDGADIAIRARQFHDTHLTQVFPIGTGRHLIGLDQNGRLWPLLLAFDDDETALARYADQAWARLGLAASEHPLWQAPARLATVEREALVTLALDHALEAFSGAAARATITLRDIDRLLDWLVAPYRGDNASAIEHRAELHGWLLERLWGWFDAQRVGGNGNANGAGAGGEAPDGDALDRLFRLLTPHADAPDRLWHRLIEDSDHLEPWIATLAPAPRAVLRARYRGWRRDLMQRAAPILAGAAGLASGQVIDSLRLASRARHLRVVDAKARVVALIEYEGGLRLLRYPGRPGADWEPLPRLDHRDAPWLGLPRALASGRRLREAVHARPDERFLFVATDRGELRLFRVAVDGGAAPALIWSQDIDMDVRCCTVGRSRTLVLGGADAGRCACIRRIWFRRAADAWQMETRVEWTDAEPGGLLRMLGKVDQDDGPRFLWAADRFRGRLYRFRVDLTEKPPRLAAETPRVFLSGRKDLHTFALDRHDRSALAVAGGRDALAFGLDRHDGLLRWVVGCHRSLTRAVYLGHLDPPQWLLCTDHPDALLVAEDGTPTGALTGIGPVTAARLLDDDPDAAPDRLLVGNRRGRLTLLHFVGPAGTCPAAAPSVEEPAAVGDALPLPGEPARFIHHPLRTLAPPPAGALPDLLALACASPSLPRDQLCAQRLLHLLWQALDRANPPPGLADQAADLLRRVPNVVLVPFIDPTALGTRLDQPGPAARAFWLRLFRRLWDDLARRNRDDNLCHQARVLSGLFIDRFLRVWRQALAAGTGPISSPEPAWQWLPDDEAGLFEAIQRCIWSPQPTAPNECPAGLPTEQRILGLQLNQAARLWAASGRDGGRPKASAAEVNRWLRLLWRLWGCPDESGFRRRLAALLQQGAVLLPPAWGDWLRALATAAAAGCPDGPPAPPPLTDMDLCRLDFAADDATAPVRALTIAAQALSGDTAWADWLDSARAHVAELARLRTEAPRVLWRELGEIEALRSHMVDGAVRRFTLLSGHPLPAVWLPAVGERWGHALELALDDLEVIEPAGFVDLEPLPGLNWHGTRAATLTLAVRNRFHDGIEVREAWWNDSPIGIEPAGLPVRAEPAGVDPGGRVRCKLDTTKPNRIEGTLRMRCIDTRLRRPFEIVAPVRASRDLVQFFPGEWTATGQRAQDLLNAGKRFHWLDGFYWGKEERRAFKEQVRERFGRDVEQWRVKTLLDAPDDDRPVFSPDLLLGPKRDARLVDALNWTLHDPERRDADRLALAIWQRARPLPPAVAAALEGWLPRAERVEHLLLRLFGDAALLARLDEELKALPAAALGAWWTGESVYADLLARADLTAAEARQLYPNPVGIFPAPAWQRLTRVPTDVLADWFGLPVKALSHREVLRFCDPRPARPAAGARGQRRPGDPEPVSAPVLDTIARRLLERLSGATVDQVAAGRVWRLNAPLVMLEEVWPQCYLLRGPMLADLLAQLKRERPGLWLVVAAEPPSGLPGRVLPLELSASMRLAHLPRALDLPAGRPVPALAELARLMAVRVRPTPELIFHSANGLGRRVERHFVGRDDECRALLAALREADDDPSRGRAILLVGGRRIGKTSLKEWLALKVRQESSAGRPARLCLSVDGQLLPGHRELQHWVYEQVKGQINDYWRGRHGEPLLTTDWLHGASVAERGQAFEALRDALRRIQEETGRTPLLLLDETRFLVAADQPSYGLFDRLRGFVSAGELILLATAFPHGSGPQRSLTSLTHDRKTPLYNTFDLTLTLGAWRPDDAWEFLRSRLGFLGVALPLHFRQRALRLTRGIPWLVHQLGLELFKALGQQEQVITRETWRRARQAILADIGADLRAAVQAASNLHESAGKGYSATVSTLLREGRLWAALAAACRRAVKDLPVTLFDPVDGAHWGKDAGFSLTDLRPHLGGSVADRDLRQALDLLVDTSVLRADAADPDHFLFAYNLFPAWLLEGDNDA